jgi:hypothetical protein
MVAAATHRVTDRYLERKNHANSNAAADAFEEEHAELQMEAFREELRAEDLVMPPASLSPSLSYGSSFNSTAPWCGSYLALIIAAQ